MKLGAKSEAGAGPPQRDRLSGVGKQVLLHASWLVLYHVLNFYLDPPAQKDFAYGVSRSINDAIPSGITKPEDVYSLLVQLQAMQEPNGTMAGSEVIAGGILLRQMRVISRKCSSDIASASLTSCAPPYSELDEEQEFKPWSGAPLSQQVLRLPEYAWQSAHSSGDRASQVLAAPPPTTSRQPLTIATGHASVRLYSAPRFSQSHGCGCRAHEKKRLD